MKTAPPAYDPWAAEYASIVKRERRIYNKRSNIERIVGGSLAFGLGTYGYYGNMEQRISAKLIYSITQSGGILAISSGIVGLAAESPFLAMDEAFDRNREMSYDQYKKIVVKSNRAQELADLKKTAISTGLLAVLYGYNGYLERQGNIVIRNTFAFLAFNFSLFSGASFYKWSTFNDDSYSDKNPKITVSLDSFNSMNLRVEF